jgi:high-affinity Fe2+/Pb2+ permease
MKTGINKETFKMNQISWSRAAVSGVIGVIMGLVITYVVSLINHTTNLQWSLTAVGFASFFAACAGYIAGARRKSQ